MNADLSSFTPLANHLWQSTVFVAIVWLATLALKRNRAAVRYWLWFAASVKFLLPFSFLVALGSEVSWRTAAPIAQPQWSFVIDNAVQPFAASTAPPPGASPHAWLTLTPILIAVWLCGVAVGLAFWLKCWMQMRRIRETAVPLPLGLPIPALSSPSQIEPGVFGIFHPVLLLPQGIESRLTPAQLEAIVAHEMAHVRRRDNLTAAIHMLVETLFWFFPPVYWLRARLIEERENACDEAVLRTGSEAESYAEGIIEVCKSYAESPAACISGISGSDLKKRVIRIVNHRLGDNLTRGKKAVLALSGMAVLVAPLVIGLLNSPLLRAQSPAASTDWEKAAGGKMSFDVASIKPSAPDERAGTNVGFDSGNEYEPFDGLLRSTSFTAASYISFAYKLNEAQQMDLRREGPKWIHNDRFDLEARAPATASKDQLRLMMQSLLADRFKLAMHTEKRQIPMFGLVLVKEGKFGPHLRRYADDPPCSLSSGFRDNQRPEDLVGGLPPVCDAWIGKLMPDGHASFGARNVTMEEIADGLPRLPNADLDRPVVDQTGVAGTFDFWLDLPGSAFGPLPGRAPTAPQTDDSAPFVEIIRDQLGLKLVPTTGQVDTPVIDHIEQPTPN